MVFYALNLQEQGCPMDYFGPHIFGYMIALLHSLGLIAAIHAVLTVRTAQGSIAWPCRCCLFPTSRLFRTWSSVVAPSTVTSRPGARPTKKCARPFPS